ncbi:MAG: S8/S53 family peptidase [Bacteroidota bacterium]
MKKNLQIALTATASLFFATTIIAQSSGLVNKKNSDVDIVPSNSEFIETQDRMVNRPEQSSMNGDVPVYDQIHSDIKWYALENENNPVYWESVDVNRIWIELDQGLHVTDPIINEFLEAQGINKLVGESRAKEKSNYFIFEMENNTPEDVINMAKAAQQVVGIKYLEPAVIYTRSYIPNDALYNNQWGPYVTYFEEAWDYGTGGNSENVVAVIDDACDWNHEDLYDQVWYGWDYAVNDQDITPDDPFEHKHGTHVTGTVAASTGNGIGVAGMVNDTVFFAKIGLPNGTLSDQGIVDAIYEIGDIERITAVNMSFGGDAPSAACEQACNYAWNNGSLLIAASGNNGQGFISWPAAYQATMAVGSIGADGMNLYLTGYSQYGNEQEICAPGGDMNTGFGVLSCIPMNGYEAMEGTSMAAPHVTGLAGLMKSLNPDLTNVDIRNLLTSTAFDYGDLGWDPVFGYGMINAQLAVETAIGGVTSTKNLNADEVFEIYPNPATHRLFIDKKMSTINDWIEIFDVTGKRIKEESANGAERLIIDVSDLPSGVYLITMNSERGSATTKFVKQ